MRVKTAPLLHAPQTAFVVHLEGRDMCITDGTLKSLLMAPYVALVYKAAERLEMGLCRCRCPIIAAWHDAAGCSECS
jgi:hypothetical protein